MCSFRTVTPKGKAAPDHVDDVVFSFTKVVQVYYPELSVWVSQEPFPNKEMEGRLPKGRLPVPKEVNRKKNDDAEAASLTPLGSNELHSPRISYLYSF
ncbi:neuronal regeneration-related protein isoform X2 [Pteropus medius]|uniref:Neuronal regeneration-related protein n=1 Tax=Pteropus vampyrus TaxID=132908 RepID=A0A6P6CPS3_PTEVA|nr:neuronal regeneration-related protein isoform X1 [Pteropus vampyrus]XP_039704367.1 neuronal regeneration-related protein isoform X2 [Pteropus giganteus]